MRTRRAVVVVVIIIIIFFVVVVVVFFDAFKAAVRALLQRRPKRRLDEDRGRTPPLPRERSVLAVQALEALLAGLRGDRRSRGRASLFARPTDGPGPPAAAGEGGLDDLLDRG